MKKILIQVSVLAMWLIGVVVASGFPTPSLASTARPACTLAATIDGSTTTLRTGAKIFVRADTEFGLSWQGSHSTTMRDQSARALPVVGQATATIDSYTRFSYRFSAGSETVTCSVKVYPVSGSVTSATVASSGRPVILKGTSRGASSIVVSVLPVDATLATSTAIHSSRISLRRSTWAYTVPKVLPDGNYRVEVATVNGSIRTVIATSTLAIGKVSPVAVLGASTIVVVPVPLLIGGRAHPSATIAVAYLQFINIGYATTSVTSVSLTQYGTAPVSGIVGVTSISDNGMAKGAVGTMSTGTPFVGTTVTVPLGLVLAPREMRLVTIKAITALNIDPHIGKTLTLWVSGVTTNAKLQSKLPLYGTTWTFGY